uniref:Uncharacterized protein n=1 Tax=Arundo donax TaxID=35708 RepID=A0A0A9D0I3_ARUDO
MLPRICVAGGSALSTRAARQSIRQVLISRTPGGTRHHSRSKRHRLLLLSSNPIAPWIELPTTQASKICEFSSVGVELLRGRRPPHGDGRAARCEA